MTRPRADGLIQREVVLRVRVTDTSSNGDRDRYGAGLASGVELIAIVGQAFDES